MLTRWWWAATTDASQVMSPRSTARRSTRDSMSTRASVSSLRSSSDNVTTLKPCWGAATTSPWPAGRVSASRMTD
ncbi:hypothetical protein [Streptomyces sp. NPDC005244]|uniref:hypothetical protein n=1 Tax=Streptomyces sp. NPDC005244 TaxID=3364708 RepID=UPI0036C415C4